MSGTGSTSPPPKANPASLTLRATPRPTVRFKRWLLIGSAGVGACLLAGVTWLALHGRPVQMVQPEQQTQPAHQGTPDAVAAMPRDYSAPPLGPRLPGDLGGPIVERERQLGINPAAPSAHDQTAEAERQRLAQLETQARAAGVLVQISNKPTAPTVANGTVGPDAATASPAASPGSRLNLDLANDQNNQGHKLDFLNQKGGGSVYNSHSLEWPASPYEVMAGSVIAASLQTGLNSDLPGDVTALVSHDVFDTVTGQILLIPHGSWLFGRYDSVVAFGQSRSFVVWQRILLPNGSHVEIDNMPATDPAGYAGLEDEVDYHTWTLLKGIAMSTLLGVGTQVTFGSNNSNLVEAIRQSAAESTNTAGQRIVENDLNIQNTLEDRPGMPLRVLINKDIILAPYGENAHAGP
jgi:type IV secretion system protein VirB10